MSIDALVYATMNNQITDSNLLNNYKQQFNIDATDTTGISNYITSDILNDTTIKRACCLGQAGTDANNGINVRIPIPTGMDISKNVDPLSNKFRYFDKKIQVPTSMCQKYPDYTPNTTKCDNFYSAYCDNIKKIYKTGNENKYDPIEWYEYKRECACYGDPDLDQGPNTAHLCYMAGCNAKEPTIYLDPQSFTISKTGCPQINCNSYINMGEIQMHDKNNFNTTVQQNCGTNSSSPSGGKTADGSSSSSSGSSSGSSNGSSNGNTSSGRTSSGSTSSGSTSNGSTSSGNTSNGSTSSGSTSSGSTSSGSTSSESESESESSSKSSESEEVSISDLATSKTGYVGIWMGPLMCIALIITYFLLGSISTIVLYIFYILIIAITLCIMAFL